MTCRHLSHADAIRLHGKGHEEAAPDAVPLCGWVDVNVYRLAGMPPWLAEWAEAGGPTFKPEKHCRICPAYSEPD